MILALNILADRAVGSERFACDLNACKGACCTMPGGRGAPLEDREVPLVEEAVAAALPYLSERNRAEIAAHGAVEGEPGDYATRCIDDRDCVFVTYTDTGIATCAIERAWQEGKSEFRKPLSCHLFPIRVHELFGGPYLHYEKISECAPARKHGKQTNTPLYKFLRDPIVRAFGQEYYDALAAAAESRE